MTTELIVGEFLTAARKLEKYLKSIGYQQTFCCWVIGNMDDFPGYLKRVNSNQKTLEELGYPVKKLHVLIKGNPATILIAGNTNGLEFKTETFGYQVYIFVDNVQSPLEDNRP